MNKANDHSDTAITQRIIREREKAGIKKVEFAERLGLTKSGYTPYETRVGTAYEGTFTVEQLFKIAGVLAVPIEKLLGLPLPADMTEEARWLLNTYDLLPADQRRILILVANALLRQEPLPGQEPPGLSAQGLNGQQ